MAEARTFAELGCIAFEVLQRMDEKVVPRSIGQVCGPITTGGRSSIVVNLREFSRYIELLQSKGLAIFDQVPFEKHLFRIRGVNYQSDSTLLEDFYGPIFESGIVKILYFIPGWSSSNGAMWEHRQAVRLNLTIDYL
ncbi:MAG: Uncharacterized protein G01um101420_258 [Parcubacteria group bacterium Gr01-1014_20]|nr:MAG: Uncharacterized protein G01um101420_258 [Parcubacteria group bacterium Gr01-1014_20]